MYSLIVEDGTVIDRLIKDKKVILPDDELERLMYWKVKNILHEHGYIHYEISNFSKPNMYSRHNVDCWKQKEYIGVGLSAHSFLNNVRYSNICNLEEYLYNIKAKRFDLNKVVNEKLNNKTRMDEFMILGLRMITGVNVKEFEKKFGVDCQKRYCKQLEKLNKMELIDSNGDVIKLTNKGVNFANLVWEEFVI